ALAPPCRATMEPKRTFIVHVRRARKTRRSVWLAEIVSRALITVGGIGTILAVATVFAFLLYVVIPLFEGARASAPHTAACDASQGAPIQLGVDEDQTMCWALFRDGTLQLMRLDTGAVLDRQALFGEPRLTAWAFPSAGVDAVFGFADGSVRTGTI